MQLKCSAIVLAAGLAIPGASNSALIIASGTVPSAIVRDSASQIAFVDPPLARPAHSHDHVNETNGDNHNFDVGAHGPQSNGGEKHFLV